MLNFVTHNSNIDQSVNHIAPTSDNGAIEARYVQRRSEYFIVYLSSHTGCNKSCRFCHLTAMKQVMMTPVTREEYKEQANQVLKTLKHNLLTMKENPKWVNFNFMSRGEALANPHLLEDSQSIYDDLTETVKDFNVDTHFLVSSIIPNDFKHDLSKVLADSRSNLYYSLYSVDPKFRKRWLPKSMNPFEALDMIADYQKKTGKDIAVHNAFIKGENDSLESVDNMIDAVLSRNIKAKFNLVRYNPHDERYGVEPDEEHLQTIFNRIQKAFGHPNSRIVDRVGFDVKASCGMFDKPKV